MWQDKVRYPGELELLHGKYQDFVEVLNTNSGRAPNRGKVS
jgi:hypothetical protein